MIRDLKRNPETIPDFTLPATEGLLEFARNDVAKGLEFYKPAEEKALKQSSFLADQVFLNKVMELRRFGYTVKDRDVRRLEDISKRADGFHLRQLIRNIERLAREIGKRPTEDLVDGS